MQAGDGVYFASRYFQEGFLAVDELQHFRADTYSHFSLIPHPHQSSRDIYHAHNAHMLSFTNLSPSYSYLASSQSCFNLETVSAFQSVYSIDPITHSLVYKPVACKVRTVPDSISEYFHITQRLPDNPLEGLLDLPVHPPEFTPRVCYMQECANALDLDPAKWLWPEELKLLQWIVRTHELAFVWMPVNAVGSRRSISLLSRSPLFRIPHGYSAIPLSLPQSTTKL